MTHPVIFKIKVSGDVGIISHLPEEAPTMHGDVIAQARGGHVWPKGLLKRMAFRWLRLACGRQGKVAAWTRTWRGPWIVIRADNGQKLPGEFASHGAAVKAEVTWLLEIL